jgi:hypothetical protein
MISADLSRETAKQPRLRQPALTVLRLAWVFIVVLYAAVYAAELPALMLQLNNLTGAALQMGFMSWSQAGLSAAIQAAGLSVSGLAGLRLAGQLVYSLGFVGLGLLLFWRQTGNVSQAKNPESR